MSVYFWIDLGILAVPLLLTPNPRLRYSRKLPAVFLAAVTVGPFFVLWDILASHYGDWSFNSAYVWPVRVAGLPLEELLFFVAVPYSCLFIYETVSYFSPDKIYSCSKWTALVAVLLLLGAALFRARIYTFSALGVCAVTLLVVRALRPNLLCSRRYWFYLGFSYAAFLFFNGILTALPVVVYHPAAVWGPRVGTIPVEDFFFNFSLLTLYLAVYPPAHST